MRRATAVIFLTGFVACHRPTEVQGLYMAQDRSGSFFPCNDRKQIVLVDDSALAARYAAAGSNGPVFVRLRGVKGHSGSIYGGQRYFQVQQILEVRARASGECPGVAEPLAPLLPPS